MITVTVDDLPHIADYLPQVEAGEDVVITRSGQPVARLVSARPMTPALAKAIATGRVTMPQPGACLSSAHDRPPLPGGGKPASAMILEDRR